MHTRYLIFFLCLALAPFAWPPRPATAQISIIPGSSAQGQEVFQAKGCVNCHAFNGVGGATAPDLGRNAERSRTPMQLASALWNHAPRMWRAQDARAATSSRPVLDSMETSDLFAYFYSLSYAKTGNGQRGAELFEKKGCATCHETTVAPVSQRRRIGAPVTSLHSPISTWDAVDDPLMWAERMWNHVSKVYGETAIVGSRWPEFSGPEMADLLTYLRELPETRSHAAAFQPGDPEQGRITFERNCETCHSFGGRTADPKIDLSQRSRPTDLTGYVAEMWNHAPVMYSRSHGKFPVLAPGEMSNLVAYLFAQRYFEEPGDVQRGKRIFQNKNCVVCHEQRRQQTGAPDLTQSTERYSAITVSSAVWRHGPTMLKAFEKQNLVWPEFKGSEMADLIAFLNSQLISRVSGH